MIVECGKLKWAMKTLSTTEVTVEFPSVDKFAFLQALSE
jgi:hypothetical protein